ncbi:S-layer domain protein [Anaerovibrio sp. JC8]|uniref:hypothetical protein n=1 Tax=Anaerovibrio sp. JC8 TaxID=1240085 RepID=UPI000A0BB2A4|nr:hypothetical protein [Anaerovibrio sp. JC8]ORT99951.1 S-layer domain protein [Anaerovibrio sp. JC8]
MKKGIIATFSALALPLLCGNALAASSAEMSNHHWAVDAIEQLAQDGFIEDLDENFGKGKVSRQDMAQIVAKFADKNVQGPSKPLADRLVVEFADELHQMGINKKNTDKVLFNNKFQIRTQDQWQADKGNSIRNDAHYATLQLNPYVLFDKNWSVNLRAEANFNFDTGNFVSPGNYLTDGQRVIPSTGIQHAYLQYDDNNVQLMGGMIPYFSKIDEGMMYDYHLYGGQVTVSNDVNVTLTAGKTNRFDAVNDLAKVYANDSTVKYGKYYGLEIYNNRHDRFTWGVAYHHWSDKNKLYEECGATAINIYEAAFGYRFDKNFRIHGAVAWTNSPNSEHEPGEAPDQVNHDSKRAYNIELDYKGAKLSQPGSFGLFIAYRQLGHYAVIAPTYDIIGHGMRGMEIGGDYVFTPNLLGSVRYFHGQEMPDETGPGELLENARGFLCELKYFF